MHIKTQHAASLAYLQNKKKRKKEKKQQKKNNDLILNYLKIIQGYFDKGEWEHFQVRQMLFKKKITQIS